MKRVAWWARGVVALLAAAAMASSAACSKREDAGAVATAGPQSDAGAIVDPPLLAFLSEARALHHEANLHEASNEPSRAIEALVRLTHAPKPHPETTTPEVEEVLADTYARLAELRMRTGDLDGAAHDIQDGVTHAEAPSYFRGHLLEVAGIIEEARAASLADAGRRTDSNRARDRALSLLREAVEIQKKVITGPPAVSGPLPNGPP